MVRFSIVGLLVAGTLAAGACHRGDHGHGARPTSNKPVSAGREQPPGEGARAGTGAGRTQGEATEAAESASAAGEPSPRAKPARSDTAPPSTARPSMALRRARRAPAPAETLDGGLPPPPPASPPENPFGYDRPVRGCFAGQVYMLPPDTPRLPRSYDGLDEGPVLHACEWNVTPRDLREGFDGIEGRSEWFAIRYTGSFRVLESGTYTFRVASDDGSRLTIDGETVVDNDGLHAPHSESGEVELTAGEHTLVLEYFQGPPQHVSLQVWVTPPGGTEGLVSVRWE